MKGRIIVSTLLALLLFVSLPMSALAATWDIGNGDITVNAESGGQTVRQGGGAAVEDNAPVIKGSSTENTVTINAEKDQTANVTLSGANIDVSSAEQFVKEYLGYAGLRCNLCKVAWGLAVPGMEPGQREELKPYEKNGRVMNFPSYHDGVKYQKTHHLEKSTYVLPLASKEKELYIAA